MSYEIYVVSHKDIRMPEGNIYIPVQVGPAKDDFSGFVRDNTGENISEKNPNYCELTAQYWAWKNRKADVKGLVHYRRLFSKGKRMLGASLEKKYENVLDEKTLVDVMKKHDAILPKKRNYYIETLWSHYEHSHKIEGLEETRKVIAEKYPDYLMKFDEVMKRRSAHMFNMIIAKDKVFSGYSVSEARIFGYISELLMDVWIEQNQIDYVELPVMFMGNQNMVKKIWMFVARKFGFVKQP